MDNPARGKRLPSFSWLEARCRAARDNVASLRARIDANEGQRLLSHVFALTTVAAAVAAQTAITGIETETPFWLFHSAVALTASYRGLSAASVAVLGSLLAARLTSSVNLSTATSFCIEAFVIALVITRMRESLRKERQRTAAADRWILELKSSERQGRLTDRAFDRLAEVSVDAVIVVLDREGRIADWRAGATRLYGRDRADVLGRSASMLFGPEFSDEQFARLLSDASHGSARQIGQHRRADGSPVTTEVEIEPLSRGGFDGFTMTVRDLTRQEAWEAFAASATETHARLRLEADVAQSQLATLQHVTDPCLNSLASSDLIRTLLDRLRTAIDAEGIALIQTGKFERRVFCATTGLQCRRGSQRPQAEQRGDEPGRALIIHNDPASVVATSMVEWPAGVSSLIAVPVVYAGSRQAVVEVVSARRRHSTEWEIALVQVVAARVAGLLRDDPYADAGAA